MQRWMRVAWMYMDRLEIIARESDRFAAVLAACPPDAPCPTCPDWTAADLLWHLVDVHHFWSRVLGDDIRTGEEAEALDEDAPERPADIRGMLGMRENATLRLVDQLAHLGDDESRWSWVPSEQTVGFTRRMQTYEATMHRVDAELTAGTDVSPIAPDVAKGAVDHCVDVMWDAVGAWLPGSARDESAATVELVASDTGDRWLVDVGRFFGVGATSGKEFDIARARRAADGSEPGGSVTGTAEELALWAWGRAPIDSVSISGSDEAVTAVRNLIEQGIQ